MKPLLILLIFLTAFFGFTSPKLCSFRNHFKIDNALLTQKYILLENDTVILYRHWIYSNGENGYGKAILKKNGNYSIRKFELDSNRNLNTSKWKVKEELKEIFQLLNDCIVKSDTNLITPSTRVSHDGEHIVEVYVGKRLLYNFCINDLWLYPNRFNNNVKLVSLLRDKEMAQPFNIKPIIYLTTKGKEKPTHTPPINSNVTIENQKFYYVQKRFLRPKIVYEWTNNKWTILD